MIPVWYAPMPGRVRCWFFCCVLDPGPAIQEQGTYSGWRLKMSVLGRVVARAEPMLSGRQGAMHRSGKNQPEEVDLKNKNRLS